MTDVDLHALSNAALAERFVASAQQMGNSVVASDARGANCMFDRMEAIDRVLRSRGPAARLSLRPLLENGDRFVRYYAAKYLLGVIPEEARRIIEGIANPNYDALSGDAGMTLDNIDIGFYKPE